MARDRRQRNPKHRPPDGGLRRGHTMNTFVKIIRNGHMAPGKLADAELHFTGGELDGLRLIGFSIWARKDGTGQNVTFPARQFTANGSAAVFSCCAPLAIRLLRIVCGTLCCRRIARTSKRAQEATT